MNQAKEREQIRLFIERYADIGFFSTGAELVDFSGDLYNVTGSTHDPREVSEHEGMAWKNLLINIAGLAEASCYVTNAVPNRKSSHPEFSVGGHMTPNSTGVVDMGGVSYLMPLCKWHNSTSRDGTAFKHVETRMLKLTGFMEGDSAATFSLRLPSEEPYSVLYFDRAKGGWGHADLSKEKAFALNTKMLSATADRVEPDEDYVVFERKDGRYYVVDANLAAE